MKFENLMYDEKIIKMVVDLEDVFIENNNIRNYSNDNSDTLDLTNITVDISATSIDSTEKEDYNVK